jgi:hypothetical protein
LRGLDELFFQLCCCVRFWFWREIGSLFVVVGKFYYDRKKKVPVVCLEGCSVVSVFGSGDYDQKKKVPVVCLAGCAVVSVFWFWQLQPEKKKLQSSVWRVVLLCQFLVLAITTGKKGTVVCLVGCAM